MNTKRASSRAFLVGGGFPRHARPSSAMGGTAFTLVEALVAMAVVGIMVTALYGGITFGICSMQIARENLRATQILLEKVEVLRLLSWDQIVTNSILPTNFVAYYDPIGATNGKGKGATYTGNITLKPFPTVKSYQPEMREVTVQVDWTTSGLRHSRLLKTYVAHYGIQNYVYN